MPGRAGQNPVEVLGADFSSQNMSLSFKTIVLQIECYSASN
jgi:hypothetical protein